MTAPSPSAPSAAGTAAASARAPGAETPAFLRIVESIAQLAEDTSVPRNIRRGAQSAKDELSKPRVALDMRVASAVYVLDDLANDPNLPTHGRTAIWSIISSLESLQ
jgi:uncharacterized protein (UPF0147 family)